MAEGSRKMIRAERGQPCERDEGNFFREMLFDILNDQLLLSRRQAAANWRRSARSRSFGPHDFLQSAREMGDTISGMSPIVLAIYISSGD